MALMTRELRASYAFVERNFNLSKRYWGWEVAWLIYSVAGALAPDGKTFADARKLLRGGAQPPLGGRVRDDCAARSSIGNLDRRLKRGG